MKPIEPGCLAVIIPPYSGEALGEEVIPIMKSNDSRLIRKNYKCWWEIDHKVQLQTKSGKIVYEPFLPEECMLRIDPDPEFRFEDEEVDEPVYVIVR